MLLPTAGALAQSCGPAAAAPEVRVNATLPQPVYRHTLTRPQIGALGGHGHMSSDKQHAGLTQTKTGFSIQPVVEVRRVPGGLCATLKKVEVNWSMVLLQVDVAAEYEMDSCAYNEILRHENQHVAIAQRAFAATERSLRADIKELARRVQPFVIHSTGDQAARRVAAQLMAATRPTIERYKRDSDRENAAIDTSENYRAISARCRNW